ncbi:hypothetical protein LCGC14_1982180 [marine sediment metagenome]|uniref:Uncharacterized protein n=1 Tax=marine sediment metagenome TaxID=412755 RepID=A0A0F9FWQ9_9ZZZZ
MVHHKKPNNFYKIKLPVKSWYNWKGKCWRLLDSTDTIIAGNLTKELAETLEQAVNLCSPALEFTKFFVEWEDIIEYREGVTYKDVEYRNIMYNQALDLMIKLGLVTPPPKHRDAFPEWREDLMYNNFYKIVNKHTIFIGY